MHKDQKKPLPVVRKADGIFKWTHVNGDVTTQNITATWEEGAWSIFASTGNIQQPRYQHFTFRIPAATPDTPLNNEEFISDRYNPTPGFNFSYLWNKPEAPPDYFRTIFLYMEGFVFVTFNPQNKTFEGRFHYDTPFQFSPALRGDGEYKLTVQ